jgi:hypothetical protein
LAQGRADDEKNGKTADERHVIHSQGKYYETELKSLSKQNIPDAFLKKKRTERICTLFL